MCVGSVLVHPAALGTLSTVLTTFCSVGWRARHGLRQSENESGCARHPTEGTDNFRSVSWRARHGLRRSENEPRWLHGTEKAQRLLLSCVVHECTHVCDDMNICKMHVTNDKNEYNYMECVFWLYMFVCRLWYAIHICVNVTAYICFVYVYGVARAALFNNSAIST